MREKRLFAVASIVCLAVLLSVVLAACDSKPLLVVYLGDSIAEGIAGASSPFTERERLGYYGIVSMRNKYDYQNRAVSGHKSADMLSYIKQEDKDARMTNTCIRTADVIHISILGNDFLLENVSRLMEEIAIREDYTKVNEILADSVTNFALIIETLRGMNPSARIFVLTLYNPMYPGSLLIDGLAVENLEAAGKRFEDIRYYGDLMLARLNGIIKDYHEAHPGVFDIIDVNAEFGRIFSEDPERGKALIYSDGVHPSPEGHAVIADATQKKFEETGLADAKTAVREYKKLRNEQIRRMYKDTVDVKKARKEINRAKSCEEISAAYFNTIRGISPVFW